MADNGQELIQVKEVFPEEPPDDEAYGGLPFLAWLSAAGDLIPAWWSQARDNELRKFWKQSDHVSGTVNTLREMMVAMPLKIVAKDQSIKSHVSEAEIYTDLILNQTESRSNFLEAGWEVGYGPFIEDVYTQDNGGWLVVEGPGRGDEPLQGPPTKLIQLDSGQCWRTQNPTYPIVYTDLDGQQYKLHKSRVINITSQASPINEMFGVGFCAVSRCINIAQNLIDIGRYKQEKLGSRPLRAILVIQDSAGADRESKTMGLALQKASETADNQGLTRYNKMPVVAIKGTANLLNLAALPDGFNELESVQLGMAVLALAFGVDMRQLAFALGVAGQTKADAEVQHLKMRGKGPGYILTSVKQRLAHKFLPPYLKPVFDYQDDEQDKLHADIGKVRSERREKDINDGVTSIRVEREIMLEEGEITEAQFTDLELADGRLPDGEDVLALFQSPDYAEILPPIYSATEQQIQDAIGLMHQVLMTNAPPKVKQQAAFALAALEKLKGQRMVEPMQEAAQAQAQDGSQEPVASEGDGSQPEDNSGEENAV